MTMDPPALAAAHKNGWHATQRDPACPECAPWIPAPGAPCPFKNCTSGVIVGHDGDGREIEESCPICRHKPFTFEDAVKTLERVSHPFMLFELERPPYVPPLGKWGAGPWSTRLKIAHKCVDSATMRPIIFMRMRPIRLVQPSEKDFLEQVWRAVRSAHEHEAGEFFKVDGQAIHHPHQR